MSYDPTNWVDGETPVNARNLNKLEQGLKEVSEKTSVTMEQVNNAIDQKIGTAIGGSY